jgi:ABC-type nitrate/sulfonate/bicarbonate transport system substrate-binding protein
MAASKTLRIGFVPEHFSTPLHFAVRHFGLAAELLPFPSGTGHMITSLRAGEIDVGIGLTEAWVAGLGKDDVQDKGYKIVGSYVSSPLCWAISTGAHRDKINNVNDIKGGKIGVSRIGSGSDIMGSVLAESRSWSGDERLEKIPCQTFENLRKAVTDATADFFMWEYFTSKRYYDAGEIKKIGEIYTPWPSWYFEPSCIPGTTLLTCFLQANRSLNTTARQ